MSLLEAISPCDPRTRVMAPGWTCWRKRHQHRAYHQSFNLRPLPQDPFYQRESTSFTDVLTTADKSAFTKLHINKIKLDDNNQDTFSRWFLSLNEDAGVAISSVRSTITALYCSLNA